MQRRIKGSLEVTQNFIQIHLLPLLALLFFIEKIKRPTLETQFCYLEKEATDTRSTGLRCQVNENSRRRKKWTRGLQTAVSSQTRGLGITAEKGVGRLLEAEGTYSAPG